VVFRLSTKRGAQESTSKDKLRTTSQLELGHFDVNGAIMRGLQRLLLERNATYITTPRRM